jgi:NAD(P)-dependent dehydrogenase (short-subunit alcohol dehydrogenase family)
MRVYYSRPVGTIDWHRNPVALVTGGASGIGAASARALAARGARVALLDLDERRGRDVARDVAGSFIAADVSSPQDWERAVDRIHAELGPIEIAHLNAGVMTLSPGADIAAASDLAAISEAAYRRIVGVNVDGVFFGLRSLVPGMAKRRRGRIVVTASVGGLTAVPFDPLYAMTKHAVIGLIRSAAPALDEQGIVLSAICPGGVDTALVPDYVRAFSPPLLAPEEVGRAVVTILDSQSGGGIFLVRPGRPKPEPFPIPPVDLA